jgi:hypothetical protein
MKVTLTLHDREVADGRDLQMVAVLANDGDAPIVLNTIDLFLPTIVLHVEGGTGKVLPIIPPSVPLVDDGRSYRVRLEKGKSMTYEFTGSDLFSAAIPPGAYKIRYWHTLRPRLAPDDWQGVLESDWIPFIVRGDAREGAGQ